MQNGVQGNWMLLGAVTFVASIFGYIMGRTRSAAAIPVQECQHVAVDTTSLSQSCRSTVQQNVALAATTGTKVGEGVLKVDEGGLEYAELTHPSGASAKVFTYGADVTSYVDASGTEWIAVRPDAKMDGSKPISGGLSHCFPQFGPGAIQQHGFARNVDWTVHSISESSVTYELTPSDYTRAMWDKPFKCLFTVTLKEDCLDTELVVENTGSAEAFDFQAALHSYFDISSIKNTSVGGSFSGKTFLNKMLDPPAEQVEERSEITIAEEYDRVYAGVNDPVLKDSGKGKQLKIVNSAGWKDTVLWNPYGNEGMGYDNFVCVESVAFTPVQLGAGEKWVGTMSLVPEPIPTAANLKVDEGGLEYAELTHPSGASAKVFIYGADVTSYVDASGTEWIAVRPDAKMDGSKPISGGLSHCFPQFGPGAIQQHGFARNVDWTVHSISESSVTYELTPSDYTRAMWDKPFKCLFTVTLKEDCLDTELVVENTGSAEAFDFQAALHSYFDISSIKNTSVGGSFSGKTFLNKMLDPPAEQVEERSEITIAEEYDRVYAGVNDPVLKDSGKGKQLKIVNSAGWKDTVLWNPYGNEGMGYDNFVCVESVAFTPVQLGAGEKWVGTMSLVPEPIPTAANLKVDEGGLEYAELTHPSGASAKVFTYGADVTSYVDASGTEWIAVRPDAKMDGSKPISGGLSHCFPQFGPGAIQQHGFARNVDWTVHSISESSVTYELTPSDYTRAMWDKPFKCLFTVTLKEDCLDTELVVENTGSAEAFDFQAALHSYFDISSIKNTSVGGSFSGKTFLNKMLDPPAEQVEERSEITIAEEYDRVYAGVNDPVLKDSGKGKQLKIVNSAGWKDTVLWNPYGNEGMGYDNFVCVESVAFTPVQLGAGEKWVGTMSLVPEPIPTAANLKVDEGGLEYAELTHPSGASAKVFTYGADVTSYVDASGTEWIAVRPDAKMDGSKPISGGLSHCFPQFGPGAIQQHGFARNVDWTVHSISESSVTYELTPSDYTRAMWDKPFKCLFTVTLKEDCLDTELVVENTGSAEAFDFQAALHSYFDISSIKNTSVGGSFSGKTFLNKMLDPPAEQVEERSEITIAEEYDRVYAGVNDPVLKDSGKGKQLKIVNSAGWKDTVLWNPYGNEGMGYDNFVCVESVAFTPVQLGAGEKWVGTMSLVPADF